MNLLRPLHIMIQKIRSLEKGELLHVLRNKLWTSKARIISKKWFNNSSIKIEKYIKKEIDSSCCGKAENRAITPSNSWYINFDTENPIRHPLPGLCSRIIPFFRHTYPPQSYFPFFNASFRLQSRKQDKVVTEDRAADTGRIVLKSSEKTPKEVKCAF